VGISTYALYALGVVDALTLASCLALGVGLALNRRTRPPKQSEYTPGGRVLLPAASSGFSRARYASDGAPTNTPRQGEPEARRRRPLTADQQATRDAWARWRAEQGR
jgi:hypothetical protein